jgi:hypothetical protein
MALTAFESGTGSFVISEMLSQENETDWIFDRRIANQYGKQLFVDSKTAGCHIHIGNMPFRIKTPGILLFPCNALNLYNMSMMHLTVIPKWRLSAAIFKSIIMMQRDCTMRWRRMENL